ncbi:MAG: pilus assembly protein TadG-related protein [Acidobacteria bacterium]|nr:pilus assembly protein TadG-related protein [Acidobacteriota bacterium]
MSRGGRMLPARTTDRGSTLFILAGVMLILLVVCAFAIDMAWLYLARVQAQRAADAAALGGATAFVNSGCVTSGCTSGGIQEPLARQQAEVVGDQNDIAGKAAKIQDGDVTFSYPNPQEPQITVTVRSAVTTFFAKIISSAFESVNVSATATAEAYNPSGGSGTPLGTACLRPFLVPNCDPVHTSPANPTCAAIGGGGYFIKPDGSIPNDVVGESWQLHTNAAPSQWYLVGYTDAAWSSGNALENHIEYCASAIYSCGTELQTANGKMVGPVDHGIEALIHESKSGTGQDTIDTSVGPPFPITGGSNNPNPSLIGKTFYGQSASIVTVPVYSGVDVSGQPLGPGGAPVYIMGYMQLFIKGYVHNGSDDYLDTVILNVGSCGGSSGGGGGGSTPPPVVASGGTTIPIRLIRNN